MRENIDSSSCVAYRSEGTGVRRLSCPAELARGLPMIDGGEGGGLR